MPLNAGQYEVLEQLHATEASSEASSEPPDPQVLSTLSRMGLCDTAHDDSSAPSLTPVAHDVLLYRAARNLSGPPPSLPGTLPEDRLEIRLMPYELRIVQILVAIGDRLQHLPAPGLAEAVSDARFHPDDNRWVLRVTKPQAQSIAYAFHLERFTGHSTASNRLARHHDIRYKEDVVG